MLLATESCGTDIRKRAWPRTDLSGLSCLVADAFDMRPGELSGSTRGCAKIARARQTAMYLARVCLGMTLSEAARLYGRDRTTAAHACRVIEDLRDDPHFDAKLAAIEARLSRETERSQ